MSKVSARPPPSFHWNGQASLVRLEVALSSGPNGYAMLSTVGVPPLRSGPPKDF